MPACSLACGMAFCHTLVCRSLLCGMAFCHAPMCQCLEGSSWGHPEPEMVDSGALRMCAVKDILSDLLPGVWQLSETQGQRLYSWNRSLTCAVHINCADGGAPPQFEAVVDSMVCPKGLMLVVLKPRVMSILVCHCITTAFDLGVTSCARLLGSMIPASRKFVLKKC